jgi:hypothetical protein
MALSVTGEQRIEFTNQVMKMLDSWGTTGEDKIVLLGLPEDTRSRKLEKYRRDEAFPDTTQVNEHLEHLVGIADALRTTFPRNVEMCAIWIRQPHRRFDNETPIALMIRKGLKGIIQVRAHLDCSFAWNASGSAH